MNSSTVSIYHAGQCLVKDTIIWRPIDRDGLAEVYLSQPENPALATSVFVRLFSHEQRINEPVLVKVGRRDSKQPKGICCMLQTFDRRNLRLDSLPDNCIGMRVVHSVRSGQYLFACVVRGDTEEYLAFRRELAEYYGDRDGQQRVTRDAYARFRRVWATTGIDEETFSCEQFR